MPTEVTSDSDLCLMFEQEKNDSVLRSWVCFGRPYKVILKSLQSYTAEFCLYVLVVPNCTAPVLVAAQSVHTKVRKKTSHLHNLLHRYRLISTERSKHFSPTHRFSTRRISSLFLNQIFDIYLDSFWPLRDICSLCCLHICFFPPQRRM